METVAEHGCMGLTLKFVVKRMFVEDHCSPVFGNIIYASAITKTVTVEKNGKPVTKEVVVDGRTVYE